MAFDYFCNQGLCCENQEPHSEYCLKHSSPGWQMYRKWRRRVIGVLVGFTVIPLLMLAATVAWRLAILAIVE